MVFLQIPFLFWDWFRTVLVYSLYGGLRLPGDSSIDTGMEWA